MTEQELTEMAILQAKGEAVRKTHTVVTKEPEPKEAKEPEPKEAKEPEPKEPKEAEVKEPKKETKFIYKVRLGTNKEVFFKAWTGKTRKLFSKLFEDLTDVDELNVRTAMSILLYDNLEEPDTYLTELEEQYLLIKIREVSLNKQFDFEAICPKCSHEQKLSGKTSEVCNISLSKYPKKLKDITYVDIKSKSELNKIYSEIEKRDGFDEVTTIADVEIALHLQKDNMDALEVLDYLDELPLSTFKSIMEDLKKVSFSLDMYLERECQNCRETVKFISQDIPDIFSEILE